VSELAIGTIVDACLRAGPTHVAATLGEDRCTFSELDAAASLSAHALRAQGVGPGDIVAWRASPSFRTLSGFLACARLGAIFAPLNPALTATETAGLLDYLQPRLVTDGDLDDGPAPRLERIELPVDDSSPHIVYLTSGSTGQPKGALVSHRASWLRAAPGGGTFAHGLRGGGGVVTAFPLYHYGGWHYVLEAWQNRRPIHLVHKASAEELTSAVESWRASALYAIPAVWERILASDGDLSSLRHADTGTSHAAADLLSRIKNRVPGATTTVLYGSTEAGRMAALRDWEIAERPGSVGRAAFPGALWLDEGEVCFASPALMDGYYRLDSQTEAVLREGVYRSGDVGELDEDGYLYLTGRTSELIRTGGESVWPVEVEAALRGLPAVADLAVIGIPDGTWGEIVCAVLVPAEGPVPDLERLHRQLDGRLARFKHPRRIVVMPDIPRTPATGQVQRRRLRDQALAWLEREGAPKPCRNSDVTSSASC
jgi:fatty-acyl-CoA synthase